MLPFFAIPFGSICIATSFLPVFERNVALNYIGPDELGLFAAGAKVALIIGFQYTLLKQPGDHFHCQYLKRVMQQEHIK